MLKEKMEDLKQDLIQFASLVEDMIDKSIKGLIDKDSKLLEEVIRRDEPRANQFDNQLDEECTMLIAQFEPVARDLRTILMVLKMNHDLERMADHAVNISESALFLIGRPDLKPIKEILPMAQGAVLMLKESIDSFIREDVDLAKKVLESDGVVDDLGEKILAEVTEYMKGKRDGIKRSLNIIRISHNLERIGDLSSNIAEEVIFIVEGKDIKHNKNNINAPSDYTV